MVDPEDFYRQVNRIECTCGTELEGIGMDKPQSNRQARFGREPTKIATVTDVYMES